MSRRIVEATSDDVSKFVATYARARQSVDQRIDLVTEDVVKILDDLGKEMKGILSQYSSDQSKPFSAEIIPKLAEDIRKASQEYVANVRKLTAEETKSVVESGSRVSGDALKTISVDYGSRPMMSSSLLATLTATQNQSFAEMGKVLSKKVNRVVMSSASGTMSASQATRKIASMLASSKEIQKGKLGRTSLATQAETIIRTELGRAFSNAQQMSAEMIAKTIPDLRKRWITGGTFGGGSAQEVRKGHKEAEDNYSPEGDPGPIPISEPFIVNDYSRTGPSQFLTMRTPSGLRVAFVPTYQRAGTIVTDSLLYPRDPSGSAGNVINCRCVSMEVLPEIEEEQEKILEDPKEIQKEVATEIKSDPVVDVGSTPEDFVEAKTIEEAQNFLVGKAIEKPADYSSMDLQMANSMNKYVMREAKGKGVILETIVPISKIPDYDESALAFIRPRYDFNSKTLKGQLLAYKDSLFSSKDFYKKKYSGWQETDQARLKLKNLLDHEFGHAISNYNLIKNKVVIEMNMRTQRLKKNVPENYEIKLHKELKKTLGKRLQEEFIPEFKRKYGSYFMKNYKTSKSEFFAEMHMVWKSGRPFPTEEAGPIINRIMTEAHK